MVNKLCIVFKNFFLEKDITIFCLSISNANIDCKMTLWCCIFILIFSIKNHLRQNANKENIDLCISWKIMKNEWLNDMCKIYKRIARQQQRKKSTKWETNSNITNHIKTVLLLPKLINMQNINSYNNICLILIIGDVI